MGYTKFGELMRIYRIKNHEVMGDISKLLNVKTPFLSAVENGKKNVPSEWANILADHYKMDDAEKEKLLAAIEESKPVYKINTENVGINQRQVAFQFARSFENMDDETALKILKLLENKRDK